MGVKSILVALNANGIFGFGKSGPCPLHVCHVIQWINLPISSVWRSYFWLEQSVNSTASLWLSLWLDKLSLEKLLEILMYGLIVLESTVITWSVFCSTALRIKCGQLKNSEQLISPILEEHSHWNEVKVASVGDVKFYIFLGRNCGTSDRNNPWLHMTQFLQNLK